jgi:hypothetical protein
MELDKTKTARNIDGKKWRSIDRNGERNEQK